MHASQIFIVFLYLGLTFFIGIRSRKKAVSSRSFDGYGLGFLMCVVAGAGEWMGGTSTTGVSEYGYLYGISGAWYTIANGIGICFLAFFFARLLRSLEKPTVPGIIGDFLGRKCQIISSALLIVAMIAVGSSQMLALGTLGESLFQMKASTAICVLGTGILIYTIFGGMLAVGYTNILHLITMYAGAILAAVLCLGSVGGLEGLKTQLPETYFSPTSIGTVKVTSWLVASVLGACTAQAGIQPILAAKDEKTAVRSSFSIAVIVAPFGIITALLGMIARVRYPGLEDAKMALPMLLMSLSPVAGGLVMASIFAAILSTASPIFLSCGTLFTRDIYGRLHPDFLNCEDRHVLAVSRWATGAAGMICILAALLLKDTSAILDIVYFAYSIRGSLFVILLFGLFWKRFFPSAAICSMLLSASVGGFWVLYKGRTGSYPISPYLSETYVTLLTAFLCSVTLGFSVPFLRAERPQYVIKPLRGESNMKSIIEYVSDYAVVTPEKIAVIVNDRKVPYGELYSLVRGYAQYLKNSGVKKGDVVVARASQSLDYVVLYLAVHLAGGVIASMEKSLSQAEIIHVAEKLNAAVIIGEKVAENPYEALYLPRDTVLADAEHTDFQGQSCSFPEGEDSADILFTTGTTGSSKGVELSHRALVATAENLIYGCGYQKETVLIAPGPLNHANAIRKLFTTLVNGSTIYILNGMTNLKAFYTALEYQDHDMACCLPPAAIRTIFALTRDRLGNYADRIDFIESATSPLPEPDKLKLCELLPNTRLYNNYGSSESASVCMYDYNRYPGKVGCIGKAMPNSRILIVDDDKKVMKSSREHMGLIACMGDVNMKGYVNEPVLTREVLKDGILYTNDIGYMDEEGFIYVAGRKGDVINVGGLKVAPTEVEAAALAIENIDDCICIPVDDRISGKALKLLVVCADPEKFNPRMIQQELSKKVESYKVPRYIEKTDKVERTYNGKLNRKAYL